MSENPIGLEIISFWLVLRPNHTLGWKAVCIYIQCAARITRHRAASLFPGNLEVFFQDFFDLGWPDFLILGHQILMILGDFRGPGVHSLMIFEARELILEAWRPILTISWIFSDFGDLTPLKSYSLFGSFFDNFCIQFLMFFWYGFRMAFSPIWGPFGSYFGLFFWPGWKLFGQLYIIRETYENVNIYYGLGMSQP